MPARLLLALTALAHAAHGRMYQACVQGRFGGDCGGVCACAPHLDCNDGPVGDGSCVCRPGAEHLCPGSRLLPRRATRDEDTQSPFRFVEPRVPLGVDPHTARAQRQVRHTVALVLPTPLVSERLRVVAIDPAASHEVGLVDTPPRTTTTTPLGEWLSARLLAASAIPFAHSYGGHQFGQWAGQLGDGRAASLGFVEGRSGLQLEVGIKGGGRTPFSRAGDGRAVLQSLCREMLGTVALRALGVPVVLAVAVVGGGSATTWHDNSADWATRDFAFRDEFYSGEVRAHPAGVLVRAAPSFVRFGSLQLAAKRQGAEGLRRLAVHVLHALSGLETHGDPASQGYLQRLRLWHPPPTAVLERCFFVPATQPKPTAQDGCAAVLWDNLSAERTLPCLFRLLVERTAALVAAWQAVGFAHGVMNTDNMSAVGTTVDLNVFGFLAGYNDGFTPNHIDSDSRYAFGRQPHVALWNLERLADAFTGTPFVTDREDDREDWMRGQAWMDPDEAQSILSQFMPRFAECYRARMALRLGLPNEGRATKLVSRWVRWLRRSGADYPLASRALAELFTNGSADPGRLEDFLSVVGAPKESAEALRGFLEALRQAVEELAGASGVSSAHSWALWAAQVRSASPRFSFRTPFLRELTRRVAEEHSDHLLEEALETLRAPFDDTPWDLSQSATESDVRVGLGMTPDVEMQTSCGGQ